MFDDEIEVDNFAGGGGASSGIARATGRDVAYAINHDPEALAMHEANHPNTKHLCESVFRVDPRKIVKEAGKRIGLAWFSPDCTHHSKAKGGKPRDSKRRGLAWVVVKYARLVRPRIIMLENVEEFLDWGPLDEKGQPIKSEKGTLFNRWKSILEALGYVVEHRVLRVSDYGLKTSRKRLFLIARCDGREIVWPKPTHGNAAKRADLLPERTAAECIDWSIPCNSIFGRKKPLAENTQRRIFAGLQRFVIDNPNPFIVAIDHGSTSPDAAVRSLEQPLSTITTENRHALIVPTLVQTGYGEAPGQAPRALDLHKPLGTVVAGGQKHALAATLITKFNTGSIGTSMDVPMPTITANGRASSKTRPGGAAPLGIVAAWMAKHYGGVVGHNLDRPLGTITTVDHHSLVTAFFIKFYSEGGQWAGMDEPMHTIPTKDRMGLVMVRGEMYKIVDIGLRMLTPRELARAQDFDDDYILDALVSLPNKKPYRLPKYAQVRMIGNSVPPGMPEILVRDNYVNPPAMRAAAA